MTTTALPAVHITVKEARSRLLVRWACDDTVVFEALKRDLRRCFPQHGDCLWNATERAWSLPAHYRHSLAHWCATWTPSSADSLTWQTETGRERSDPGGHRPARGALGLDAAYKTLHLRKTAPVALVRAARRALATTAHSDLHGGSDAGMAAINAAADIILSTLEPAS